MCLRVSRASGPDNFIGILVSDCQSLPNRCTYKSAAGRDEGRVDGGRGAGVAAGCGGEGGVESVEYKSTLHLVCHHTEVISLSVLLRECG